MDFEPRGGCKVLHLGSRKNLPNRFVRQDEELGGGADARTPGGALLCFGRDTVLQVEGRKRITTTPRRMHVKFYKFILYKI